LGIDAALALGLAQVKPVFTTRSSVASATGLPVLGTVSMSVSQGDRRRRAIQAGGFGAVVAGLLVAFGTVFFVEVMGPGLLDLVKQVTRA
ncbi:MAG: hypothetical protein AAFY44_17635, partial [Pseudomonadota bacterium]